MAKRVIHVVPHLRLGGAEQMVVHLVCGLQRCGYEPAIVALGHRSENCLESAVAAHGIQATYLGKGNGFHPRTFINLRRALRTKPVDILHTHVHVLRYVLPSTVRSRDYPVVHTVHNIADREVEPSAQWLQKFAFGHGVLPVACSHEVAASLSRRYELDRVQVIANCIPVARYADQQRNKKPWREQQKIPIDAVVFTCVALFRSQKNHELLLNAFADRLRGNERARLLLAGSGPTENTVRAQASKLGLEERIHFLGLRDDIPSLLGASDAFVLASDYEGNPLAVMEAMAAGLPVISTRVGGVPELVNHGREGFLVEKGDRRGLSEAMTLLASVEEQRIAMGRRALNRAKTEFDLDSMVNAYAELYDRLTMRSRTSVSLTMRGAVS